MSTTDCLETVTTLPLNLDELDANFQLKYSMVCAKVLNHSMQTFRRTFDVASIRKRRGGTVPVMLYLDLTVEPVSLPVLEPLETRYKLRFGRSKTAANPDGILQQNDFELSARRGFGTVMQAQDAVGPELVPAARCHVLSARIRPLAPKEERIELELPEELAAYAVHDFGNAAPSVEQLLAIDDSAGPLSTFDVEGVWGVHSTDPWGIIYSAEYVRQLEAVLTTHLVQRGAALLEQSLRRVQMLFRVPFRAADRYWMRARFSADANPVASVAFHLLSNGEMQGRPAIVARMETRPSKLSSL